MGTLSGGADNSGLYRVDGGVLSIVARAGETAPDGSGTFRSFSGITPRINRNCQVAFRIATSSKPNSYNLWSAGTLTPLAFSGQQSPDGNGAITVLTGDASLNNSGKIAFSAGLTSTNSSGFGLLLADTNGLTVLVRSGQTVPDGNGQIIAFSTPNVDLNDADQIAFVANLTGTTGGQADNLGLYRASPGTFTPLARKGELVPGGNGRFLDFSGQNLVSINNNGVVAFLADLTGTAGGTADNAAIYIATGTNMTQVARKGQPAPDGNGVFAGFHAPALNNRRCCVRRDFVRDIWRKHG